MNRLATATLELVRDAEVPRYDRSPPPSIVHVGVGGFARAHLAVYADDLLASDHPATIRGVSLRSHRAERELAEQDGLFSVTTREHASPPKTRIVGSLTSITTGEGPAIDAIADPGTTLVTLTVTEKGYRLDASDSVPFVLATALDLRRTRTHEPLVIASLDNLIDNGSLLERQVQRAARWIGGSLDEWITEAVQFPRSVVDRMVPAATSDDREEVAHRLGVVDQAAVVAEDHRSWVIEAVDGLPPLDRVGVEVVTDLDPYQQRKLWLLNGPHSALAYAGLVAGHTTIAAAAADPLVVGFVRHLGDDVLEVVDVDLDQADAFARTALHRFGNPALGHRCTQVGADGSTKLPQRILPVMSRRRSRGLSSPRHALVVACWLAAVTGTPVARHVLPPLDDPAGDELRRLLRDEGVTGAVKDLLGDAHPDASDEIVDAFAAVTQRGLDAVSELS